MSCSRVGDFVRQLCSCDWPVALRWNHRLGESLRLLLHYILLIRVSQFDGFLARKCHTTTVLGSILDPAADKALVGTLVITLTMQGLIPCEPFVHEKELDPHVLFRPTGHHYYWP